jgi:hypothetical protein
MTSPEFVIERDFLNFLIGGGDTGETSFELLIDGKIFHSVTGRNEETLRWRNWDVRGFRGKKARIRIVDTKSGDWGHAVSDDLVHWKEPKIALYQHSFSDMCFSGTAIIDKDNTSGFKTGKTRW